MNTLFSGNALLALAAAAIWGGSDFSGGMGVKAAGGSVRAALRVILLSHITSFVVLLGIAHLRGDAAPHGALLAWGLAAGVLGGLSLTAFYIALSRGAMGASAAISGLLAAAIPAAVAMWMDGSPGARPLLGFVVAGLAIWLIAAGSADETSRGETPPIASGTMLLATLAGVGFGFYFVALKMAGPAGVIWPMATSRIGSLCVCSLMLLALQHFANCNRSGEICHPEQSPLENCHSERSEESPHFARTTTLCPINKNAPASRSDKATEPRIRLNRKAVGWALATALLDTSGNMLFVAATRAGRLDVAAVLASLYPATTILLAALALGEWPTRRQAIGMATAAIAVVLIAL
ncbi:MAG: DMT family transporter [Acidobacteriaceae bacterium]|nr:DMT family transporter [Acidobacteriaceae bacterium]